MGVLAATGFHWELLSRQWISVPVDSSVYITVPVGMPPAPKIYPRIIYSPYKITGICKAAA
jgi:hypothetical protein